MPPRKKPQKIKTPFLLRFLPQSAQVFVARRIMDVTGLGLALTGGAVLMALLTYAPLDPSFSVAGASGVRNILGHPGASLADLLVQAFGGAAFLFAVFPLIWGICLIKRRAVRPVSLRVIAFGLAVFSASTLLSVFPAPTGWLYPWLGGPVGTLLMQQTQQFLPGILVVGVSVLTFLAAAFYAATLSYHESIAVLKQASRSFSMLVAKSVQSARHFVLWVQHYNDPSWLGKQESKIVTPQKTEKIILQKNMAQDQATAERAARPTLPAEVAAVATASVPNISVTIAEPSVAKKPAQSKLKLEQEEDWEFPSIDLMHEVPAQDSSALFDKDALRRNAEMLQTVLADFNVQGDITAIHPGPVVTLYELEPAPGTKSSRVISLADDIARSMSAVSVRCAVVPGRNVIGIELPNRRRQTVFMRELLETSDVQKAAAKLPLVLGKDIGGKPVIGDLTKMPHLLVAGTTGSGKSVAVNTMILSLLYRLPPEKCRFIMIDPKMLELSVYDDIPHLLSPVVTEPGKAVVSLKWTVAEMEDRYRAMSKLGVRNIEGYNQRIREARSKGEILMRKVQTGFDPETGKPVYEEQPLDLIELPYIVVIVDEFADLMLVAGKDVENAIQRLAQMARAAGIHLIMATQRPSVDVITGVIKANFPTRISFAVTSKIDSRTILGEGGAEQLLGMGDMLYMAGGGRISRVHGPFVSDEDVENVVNFLKTQAEPQYITEVTEGGDYGDSEVMNAMFGSDDGEKVDELYDEAVAIIAREGKASTSFVQRYLQIGYNRAARIIEEMERQGVVSPASKTGKREVLIGDHGYRSSDRAGGD
ncbi:MAG: DNA translocase FtsK 4TM domain-containing protein [Rhodospirillales bacterium]|nr:DNA translocase FtsK 4TM domain-containing protein [Rhodospirillales bacterium]